MTLAARLTAFFVAALAVVLVGFGAALCLLLRADLDRHLEERLEAAVRTLTAAVEIESDGLSWQPTERRLAIPGADTGEPVVWRLTDGAGRPVDGSDDPGDLRSLAEAARGFAAAEFPPTPGPDGRWLLARVRLDAPLTAIPDDPDEYRTLVLTAGVSREASAATVRRVGLLVGLLTTAALLAAAAAGRAFSRQALRPVSRMAASARGITAADPGARLAVPASHDELADLGAAFNGLLDRMRAALDREREFAGNASHQLRTPLTAALGRLDVCLRRPRSADEYRSELEAVREEVRDLGRIVEAVLFLARAEADAATPGFETIDLRAWSADLVRAWSERPRGDDLRAALGDGPVPVSAHPVLLRQLADNLLDNAFKYSPPGTPVTLSLSTEPDGAGRRAVLAVEDRGPGLAAEEASRVFDPFYRSADARSAGGPGTGLGLAVADRIARTFGGAITVGPAPGGGCRFEVRLPIACPVAVPIQRPPCLRT